MLKKINLVINETKTKVMIFNQATSIDVHPTIKMDPTKIVEVVDEMKLLGIMMFVCLFIFNFTHKPA